MRKITHGLILWMAIFFSACNNTETGQKKATGMNNNLISIAEIPVADFARAVRFYESVLAVSIEETAMDGTQMGVLPGKGETVSVALVKGNDYKPTADGAVLYLNAGKDLQPMLERIKQHGGQVIVPKTEISPEMGYYALFIDTEGNKLGLHAAQ